MRPLLLAVLLFPGVSAAEQWVYSAYAGGGAGLQLASSGALRASGSVVAESVLGLTDELNLEAPLLIELGGIPAASLGLGVEYVYFRTNHWRLDLGAGVAIRHRFDGTAALQSGLFFKTAVRWLFTWGVGAAFSLHLLTSDYSSALIAFPSLSLYQEFW